MERTQTLLWVGSISLMLAVGMSWWNTPLEGKIRAISVPLTRPLALGLKSTGGFHLDSYGAVLLGIAGLAILLTLLRAPRRILFYLGAAAMAVCIGYALHIVFRDVTIVDSLLDQRDQEKNINAFSKSYLNGVSSFLQPEKELTTDTLLDRVAAVQGLIGFGWWSALIGGALVAAGAFYKRGGRALVWDALLLLLVFGLLAGFYTARGLEAERSREQADRDLARGRNAAALEGYRSAIGLDPNLGINQGFAYNAGSAAFALNRTDLPELHLYLGDNFLSVKDYENAEAEYDRAANAGANPALVSKKRIVARTRNALSHYAKGRPTDAITEWHRALAVDPGQIQAHFFLTKAYLDIDDRDQSKALSEADTVLDLTAEKLIRGDTYNLLGLAYYKQRDYAKAREMYALSNQQFKMVKKIINFESMKGLQGI